MRRQVLHQSTPEAQLQRTRERDESERRLNRLVSSPHGGGALVVDAHKVADVQSSDAYKQAECVYDFFNHTEVVNETLGPIVRQLVDPLLLSLKFNGVHQELLVPGSIFNVCLFLRLGQRMYLRSTALKEIRLMNEALKACDLAHGPLHMVSEQMRLLLLLAGKVTHAGPENETASRTFYAKLHMMLVLSNLVDQGTHAELFSQMDFLAVLKKL